MAEVAFWPDGGSGLAGSEHDPIKLLLSSQPRPKYQTRQLDGRARLHAARDDFSVDQVQNGRPLP